MVLLLAWETWCPTWGFLPVTWQTRAMESSAAKIAHYKGIGAPFQAETAQLQEAALGERHGATSRDDEMIEHLDVDECERGFQRSREDLVGVARLGDARRMVVREDHRGGIVLERAFHDLARIDARLRQSAAQKLFRRDYAVLRVEKHYHEHFLLASREREAQIIAHGSRSGQRIYQGDLLLERTARQLEGC